ncbi:hypothetical protein QA612_09525 [Evansella sp. AB-P1]|uniref:hypothetical protein n=1 Tax=Evansella sp. AB-P1 TaxID=3037653 RepID=UPI00241FED57|nr:hypothetical protein [Evansella sp. AB-P1]MDG5787738.1 hypothetical protein [Evansella sp. AB-P1]
MIVGYGRLAKAIIEVLPNHRKVKVFSRSKKKVLEMLKDNRKASWISPSDFSKEKDVWLMLPADEIPKFLDNYRHLLHPRATIYYCATKGKAKEIIHKVYDNQKVVPVKFITEANQLIIDKKGIAAIPETYKEHISIVEEWFERSIEIVIASEEDVFLLNKAATQKAIELVFTFKKDMLQIGLSEKLIEHAIRQIVPGVIQSYYNGMLGGFGQQVMNEKENEDES